MAADRVVAGAAGSCHLSEMARQVDLRVLELLAARLCHDLIGPIAAIGNGVELLDDDDPEFAKDAIALVGDSARKANKRLQFFRFTYGFYGGGVAGPAPHELAIDFLAENSIVCEYGAEARSLPPEQQKLACNMLAIAGEALPRGGRLVLETGAAGLSVEATGETPGLSAQIRAALGLEPPAAELTSRIIGAYFAGLLARDFGWRLAAAERPGGFRVETLAGAPG